MPKGAAAKAAENLAIAQRRVALIETRLDKLMEAAAKARVELAAAKTLREYASANPALPKATFAPDTHDVPVADDTPAGVGG